MDELFSTIALLVKEPATPLVVRLFVAIYDAVPEPLNCSTSVSLPLVDGNDGVLVQALAVLQPALTLLLQTKFGVTLKPAYVR